MVRIRYELDPHNKLVAKDAQGREGLRRWRSVYDGRFKVSKGNSLTYHIKSPSPPRIDAPHQVKLKGRWSLDKDHNFVFTLDKWKRETFGDKLTFRGGIVGAKKDSLLFALITRKKDALPSTYILQLKGLWLADRFNRLTFKAEREKGRYDILTFRGKWEVDKNYRIIYHYRKAQLLRERKKTHTLIFEGHWDIKEKGRISYVLDKKTNSAFNFKSSLGIFKEKYIKYEVGIRIFSKAKPRKETIVLFGSWKIKKNKGLLFEVELRGKKVHSLSFGADAQLTSRDRVSFRLKNSINKRDIGINLQLSRKILKGEGEIFLRFLKTQQKSAIFIGAGRKW